MISEREVRNALFHEVTLAAKNVYSVKVDVMVFSESKEERLEPLLAFHAEEIVILV